MSNPSHRTSRGQVDGTGFWLVVATLIAIVVIAIVVTELAAAPLEDIDTLLS